MSKIRNRFFDRKILAATAVLYLIRGLTIIWSPAGNAVLAKGGAFVVLPAAFWGWGFIAIGLFCLIAPFFFSYTRGRTALALASAWAFGFSTVYLALVILGDLSVLSGVVVWIYIGVVTSLTSRQLDPHLLGKVNREKLNIQNRP